MTIKIECADYGYECNFVLEGRKSVSLLKKLRDHMEQEHGIDYSLEVVIQMVVNSGHSRDSIRDE